MMFSRTQIHNESIKMTKNEKHSKQNNAQPKECQEYNTCVLKTFNFGLNVVLMFQKYTSSVSFYLSF